MIDNLMYGYNGNQLQNMADNAPTVTKNLGFKPRSDGNYTYNANGNLGNMNSGKMTFGDTQIYLYLGCYF